LIYEEDSVTSLLELDLTQAIGCRFLPKNRGPR
jgi:hypothetical protein